MRWFLGVLLLLAAALALESGLLAYAMYVLLGLLLVSRYLSRRWIANLSASRKCPRSTAEVGETVPISVTVKNSGRLPVPWVLIEDVLPRRALAVTAPRLKVLGKRLHIALLWGNGQTNFRYRLRLKMRGYYQVGPVLIETGDLFGLHRRYRVDAEPHFLLVYPKAIPLEGYDLASRRPLGEIRLTHRLFEDPTRISGVREYQAGDPLNRIHWRATARTGALHSKLYEPSSLAGATLVLDFHQAGYADRGEPVRSELAVTAAASLALALYQLGQQIGLVTNGRDAADRIRTEGWEHEFHTRRAARKEVAMKERSQRLQPLVVPARRGVDQYQRIRETLARVELTDGLSFDELLVECAGRLTRDATVIALLPAVSLEGALALGNLRRAGHAVAAVLVFIDDGEIEGAYAKLMAEGIRDIRHVKNEAEVPALCRLEVRRMGPYTVAIE